MEAIGHFGLFDRLRDGVDDEAVGSLSRSPAAAATRAFKSSSSRIVVVGTGIL